MRVDVRWFIGVLVVAVWCIVLLFIQKGQMTKYKNASVEALAQTNSCLALNDDYHAMTSQAVDVAKRQQDIIEYLLAN